MDECQLCPAGKYCEGYGKEDPTNPCDAGFFCRGGADSARPRDIGNATNATTTSDTCYEPYDCVCPAVNATKG